jgi:hypothetical protein
MDEFRPPSKPAGGPREPASSFPAIKQTGEGFSINRMMYKHGRNDYGHRRVSGCSMQQPIAIFDGASTSDGGYTSPSGGNRANPRPQKPDVAGT